jgi:hypothetical protein
MLDHGTLCAHAVSTWIQRSGYASAAPINAAVDLSVWAVAYTRKTESYRGYALIHYSSF